MGKGFDALTLRASKASGLGFGFIAGSFTLFFGLPYVGFSGVILASIIAYKIAFSLCQSNFKAIKRGFEEDEDDNY